MYCCENNVQVTNSYQSIGELSIQSLKNGLVVDPRFERKFVDPGPERFHIINSGPPYFKGLKDQPMKVVMVVT